MGALKLSSSSSEKLTDAFNADLKKRFVDSSSTSSSSLSTAVSDAKKTYSSSSTVPTFGFNELVSAGVGASVFASLLDPAIVVVKNMYSKKMEDLKVGDFAEPATPVAPAVPEPSPTTSTLPTNSSNLSPASSSGGVSILDILKISSDNVGSIAEVLLYSNNQILLSNKEIIKSNQDIATNINKLMEVILLNGEVQQAYSDINLELQYTLYDTDVAYKEQNLTNHTELMDKLNEVVTEGIDFDTLKSDLNSRMNAIDNVNNLLKDDVADLKNSSNSDTENIKFKEDLLLKLGDLGVTIKRSENEISLTDKNLEKVNYELTPSSVSDIHGNDIVTASPLEIQTMKNIGVATSTALENSTTADELGLDDFNDSFDLSTTDILKLFTFNGISDNLIAISKIDENSFASHIPEVNLK